nr:unnamed protein product [Digitaria exilis]
MALLPTVRHFNNCTDSTIAAPRLHPASTTAGVKSRRAIIVQHAPGRHYWLPHEHWLFLSSVVPLLFVQESRCPIRHVVLLSVRVLLRPLSPSSAQAMTVR